MFIHCVWPSRRRRWSPALLVTVLAFAALVGCSAPPPVALAGGDPADPRAQVPPVRYQSSLGNYVRQRPVEPRPWGEQNERVAPKPRAGE